MERKHRHILNLSRSLLFQGKLPVSFWGEAVLKAVHLINYTPSEVLHGQSPYEFLYGFKPSYEHLRVFGSLCYTHHRDWSKDKFLERSRKCVFVCYPFGKKGWKVFDLESRKFFTSRDVVFHETEFPYSTMVFDAPLPTTTFISPSHFEDDDWLLAPPPINKEDRGSISEDRGSISKDRGSKLIDKGIMFDDTTNFSEEEYNPLADIPFTDNDDTDDTIPSTTPATEIVQYQTPPEDLGRGQRARAPPSKLQDYVLYNAVAPNEPHLAPSGFESWSYETVQGKTPYPLTDYVSDSSFSPAHCVFLAAITSGFEPKSYKEAIKHDIWKNSMKDEIVAMEENETFEVASLPPGKVPIGCGWVYKLKYNADGTVERLKSRLVARGNRQVEGEHFDETFAPVVKMTTVRTILSLVAKKGCEAHQMDVHNAFLHGDLEDEVYMTFPPGFTHTDPSKVLRLRKSIYGLQQAPKCWFSKLQTALPQYEFVQTYSDYSMFVYSKNGIELLVLVYVDDLVICGNAVPTILSFKAYLGKCFRMKDLGLLKYFLGIEVSRSAEGIFMSQRKYSLDIVAESDTDRTKS